MQRCCIFIILLVTTDIIYNVTEIMLPLSNIWFLFQIQFWDTVFLPSSFQFWYMCAFLLTRRNKSSIFGLTKISYANIFSWWLSQRARILFCGCLYLSFFLCCCISTKICFIFSVRTILYVMMSVCMYVRILYDAVFWKHFIALLFKVKVQKL